MSSLPEQLRECLQGRICLIGLGNVDQGDDGLGVRLAERLLDMGVPHVVVAGPSPERYIGSANEGVDSLVFVDAVEFGGTPGSVVLLDCEEMTARFPQISTHKISVGLLAKLVESSGKTKAWLLGVQPETIKQGQTLTPVVERTLDALCDLLCDVLRPMQPEGKRAISLLVQANA